MGPSREGSPGGGGDRNVGFTDLQGLGETLETQWSTPLKAGGYVAPQSGGMDFEPPTSDFSTTGGSGGDGGGGGRPSSRETRRRSHQASKDPNAQFGRDRDRAAELRADADGGDARSMVLLGYMYFDIGDRGGAEAWFTKGAAKHDAEAHFALGMLAKTSPEAASAVGATAEAQGRKRVVQCRFNVGGFEATPERKASTL